MKHLCMLIVLTVISFVSTSIVSAATITVDSDVGEASPDALCNFGEAIDAINNGSDYADCAADITDPYGTNDTIAFNVNGGGVQTITFNSSIPTINQPVLIDGLTQPGGASCGTTTSDLNGNSIDDTQEALIGLAGDTDGDGVDDNFDVDQTGGYDADGDDIDELFDVDNLKRPIPDRNLLINLDFNGNNGLGFSDASDITIQGVALVGADGSGLSIQNTSDQSNYTIRCSHIGLAVDGLTQDANDEGVRINTSASISNIVIGGNNLEDRNIIAGNTCNGASFRSGVSITDVDFVNNYIGVDKTGITIAGNGYQGISFQGDLPTSTHARFGLHSNVISGNGADASCGSGTYGFGVYIGSPDGTLTGSDLSVVGNIMGLGADGMTLIPNYRSGISITDVDGGIVGGLGVYERNILSGNGNIATEHTVPSGLLLVSSQNITIQNNYIGTDISGLLPRPNFTSGIVLGENPQDIIIDGNVISGNNEDGLYILDAENLEVYNNIIGLDAGGQNDLPNNTGINMGGVDNFTIGDVGQGNTISGNASIGLLILDSPFDPIPVISTGVIQGNYFGTTSTGTGSVPNTTTNITLLSGSNIQIGGTQIGEENIITGSQTGIVMAGLPAPFSATLPLDNVTLLGNLISGNNFGIDIANEVDIATLGLAGIANGPEEFVGPNTNDINDTDSGANDYLNHPIIYDTTPTGPDTEVSFFLDVPAGDYRIEFFKNNTLSPSNHGEGETFLDALEITHPGGLQTFTHTLTGITNGDIISTTATEIEDPLALDDLTKYGSTSEFGNTITVASFGPDFGDAPDSYHTTSTNNGPYHLIDGTTYLGSCVDADNGQLTNTTATGDNTTSDPKSVGCTPGQDDEDGVTFPSTMNWNTTGNTITIEASTDGILNAWVDFDFNGTFDPSDMIADNTPLTSGSNTLTFDIPTGTGYQPTYARFRFSKTDIQQTNKALGESLTGEVEDYRIYFGVPPTPSSGGGSGGGSVKFICKDPEATNYDDSNFGRHKQSKCEYEFDTCFQSIDSDCSSTQEVTNPPTEQPATTPNVTNIFDPETQCDYFQGYWKKGDQGHEVAKLQDFLNKYMNTNLMVDGDFGKSTKQAVKDFQEKHRADILDPWNLKQPTGHWYKTTQGNANEILGCHVEDRFLEDVNVINKFDNETLFDSFKGFVKGLF